MQYLTPAEGAFYRKRSMALEKGVKVGARMCGECSKRLCRDGVVSPALLIPMPRVTAYYETICTQKLFRVVLRTLSDMLFLNGRPSTCLPMRNSETFSARKRTSFHWMKYKEVGVVRELQKGIRCTSSRFRTRSRRRRSALLAGRSSDSRILRRRRAKIFVVWIPQTLRRSTRPGSRGTRCRAAERALSWGCRIACCLLPAGCLASLHTRRRYLCVATLDGSRFNFVTTSRLIYNRNILQLQYLFLLIFIGFTI